MKKLVAAAIAASLLAASAGLASASDPVETRKNGMQGVGLAMGTLAGMAKGEIPFNDKQAKAALQLMKYVALTYDQHFPEGSDMAANTTAAPKIWEDIDGFKQAAAKFAADTSAAIAAAPASAADLGPLLGSVGGNCKACHETFRIKQN